MRLLPLSVVVCLSLTACVVDNELNNGKDDASRVDTGNLIDPPDTDTQVDTDVPDTDTELPRYCEDRYFGSAPVDISPDCDGGPTTPDWSLEAVWSTRIGSGANTPAVVGQLNDDDGDGDADENDIPDIIVMASDTRLISLRADDGTQQWTRMLTNSMGSIPAIGDVDGDGFPEIVMDYLYMTTALSGEDGSVVWTGPSYSAKDKGSCGAHGVADLDGDGVAEVYLGGQIVDGASGDLRGSGDEGDGLGVGNTLGMSVAADLDGDGNREVIVGNAAYDADGNTVWMNDEADGTVAVADLDVDGVPEVVSVGNYGVFGMDNVGNVLWNADLGGALASAPVIADINGDGVPEVIVPTSRELFVFDADGNEMWTKTASASSTGRGGASAYDLNGDGSWEVVWSSPSSLMILDGEGNVLTEESMTQPRCAGPVAIVDIDADKHAEIIATDYAGLVTAYRDTSGFTTARTVWHQSDYSITNVSDDGSLPTSYEPNWMGDNNFRAGPSVAAAMSIYPVIRDVCSDECADGSVWVWYSLANNGLRDVTESVDLEVWGTVDAGPTKLTSMTWTADVASGEMSEAAFLELTGVPRPLRDISVRIVGTSATDVLECNSDDDAVAWGAAICE